MVDKPGLGCYNSFISLNKFVIIEQRTIRRIVTKMHRYTAVCLAGAFCFLISGSRAEAEPIFCLGR